MNNMITLTEIQDRCLYGSQRATINGADTQFASVQNGGRQAHREQKERVNTDSRSESELRTAGRLRALSAVVRHGVKNASHRMCDTAQLCMVAVEPKTLRGALR